MKEQTMYLENMNNLNELPFHLSVENVASILGMSKNKAYELCHSKSFPCVKVGKRKLIIPKPAFINWLNNPNRGGV
jgi:excisionase family DNA binding protein